MSGDQPPGSPPAGPPGEYQPGSPPPPGARIHWAIVFGGLVIGAVSWVAFGIFLSVLNPNGSSVVYQVGFLAMFLGALGLIIWPRTRRVGQGLVLGIAIALVIGAGLCVPVAFSG